MKTLFVSIGLIVLSLTMFGCLNHARVDAIDFSELAPMNDVESVDLQPYTDESSTIATVYLSEIKETHQNIQRLKSRVETLVDTLKDTKTYYQAHEITLDDDSKTIIIESLKTIRLNRFMLVETTGKVYQPLIALYQNRDAYTHVEAKTILTNVYHTLNARQQIYENIYEALTLIHAHLQVY